MLTKENIKTFLGTLEKEAGSIDTETVREYLLKDNTPETRMNLVEVVKEMKEDSKAYKKIKEEADATLKEISNKANILLEAFKPDLKEEDEIDAVKYVIYNKGSEKCIVLDEDKIPLNFKRKVPEHYEPDLNLIKAALTPLAKKETEYAKIEATINVNYKNKKVKKGGK